MALDPDNLTTEQYVRVEDAWSKGLEEYLSAEATTKRRGEPIPRPAYQCAGCKRSLMAADSGEVETHFRRRTNERDETGWLLCSDCVTDEDEPQFDDFPSAAEG